MAKAQGRRLERQRSASQRAARKRARGGRPGLQPADWVHALLFLLEWISLTAAGCAAALGVFGQTFPLLWSLRPSWLRLAASATGAFVGAVILVAGWSLFRVRLAKVHRVFPPALACILAAAAWTVVQRTTTLQSYEDLKRQLSGREESERQRIAHQVYAAYRRAKLEDLALLLRRAEPYLPSIDEAAARFDLPTELLVGIAATESSFIPRTSRDGGKGLFQITAAPEIAHRVAKRALGVGSLDLENVRHNAFLAAATLRYYWQQQNGDLFLALLAYNIGPANGGLLEIMHRYGAKDFLTIQPYLQALPADYPIRVLTAALAYRLKQRYGKLLPYEISDNARKIQALGIPGLDL